MIKIASTQLLFHAIYWPAYGHGIFIVYASLGNINRLRHYFWHIGPLSEQLDQECIPIFWNGSHSVEHDSKGVR